MSVVIPEGGGDHRPILPGKSEAVRDYLGGLTRIGHPRFAPNRGALKFRWDLPLMGVSVADADRATGAFLEATDKDYQPVDLRYINAFSRMRDRLGFGGLWVTNGPGASEHYWHLDFATEALIRGWSIAV